MRRCLFAAVLLLAGPALAQPDPETATSSGLDKDRSDTSPGKRWRVPLIIGGTVAMLLPPTYYYWHNSSLQREDWELGWDRESWGKKLTFEAVRFDSNRWEANAARHPLAGAFHYGVGRANGLGMLSSVALTFGASAVWEYVVEFREVVSANDMVVNTISAVSIGEPLFQLGLLADQPHANIARRGLALVASPFDRTQRTFGLSALERQRKPWNRLDAQLGTSVATFGPKTRTEAQLGLDLAIVTEPAYGVPGTGAIATRPAAFNEIAVDLRLGDDAPEALNLPGIRFSSATTYFGRYQRNIDEQGSGTDTFIGAWTGVDIETRRLANEWDKMTLFHLVGPKLQVRRVSPTTTVTWDLAAAADVGMVQAHVFGGMQRWEPEPQTSSLQARGYYYTLGPTVSSRLKVEGTRLAASLEGAAHQMWSIDGFDRIELHGGPNDPEDLSDQRVRGTATAGVRPGSGDTRVQLFTNVVLRRGAWDTMSRASTELDAGAMVVTGF